MYKRESLITDKLPPLDDKEFDTIRKNIKVPDCRDLDIDLFKQTAAEHFFNTSMNKLHGVEAFVHQDVIVGCQQYIDNLISKNGLDGLQIFEHDYHYYKLLDPNIKYVTVDNLSSNKPLLLALPFPGHLDKHRDIKKIIDICNHKNIDVHLDCAWLVSAFDIDFDFDQPCIKSFAMSFSKAYCLHWNKVGIRWTRDLDPTDTITILNQTNAINRLSLYVAQTYMKKFPIDYLCKKHIQQYFEICNELKLRPSKIIHACFSIDWKQLLGLKKFFY